MVSWTVIVMVVAYVLILAGIAWRARIGGSSVAGYFMAGKNLSSWVVAFNSIATAQSRWILLGLTGFAYIYGITAFWVVLGELLGVVLAWTFVAPRFKEYTDRYDSITVPDYLADRFLDRTHTIRVLSAVIIFAMVLTYASAQLASSGWVISAVLGTSYSTGALLCTLVIVTYTLIGGYKAVAHTDLFQGLLIFVTLIVLPTLGVWAAGGWGSLIDGLSAVDPKLVSPMGHLGLSFEGIVATAGLLCIGVAFLGAPQLLTCFMAARDRVAIRKGRTIAVVTVLVFDVGAVLTGITARFLFPGLESSSEIQTLLSTDVLPELLVGLTVVAVLAAIMSTVDSLLILASAVFTRDLTQKALMADLSESQLALLGRGLTVVLGLGAVLAALLQPSVVSRFVVFAWSGLSAAFLPVVLCSLFWKGTTRLGAISGMTAGFGATVVWVAVLKAQSYNLYEMIPGLVVGLLVTVGVSLMTEPPTGAAGELEEVRRAVGGAQR